MTATISNTDDEFVSFSNSREKSFSTKFEFDSDTSTSENSVIDNVQRIQNFETELIELRVQTRIVELKIEVNRFRFDADATTIVESFFVFAKNVNASHVKNANDDSMTNERKMQIQFKFLKLESLKSYKKVSEKKHIK